MRITLRFCTYFSRRAVTTAGVPESARSAGSPSTATCVAAPVAAPQSNPLPSVLRAT